MTHGNSLLQSIGASTPAAHVQTWGGITSDVPLGSFGEYELLEEIARGGMGVVYRARQKSLGRTVAVKMILAGAQAGKEFVQRFRTESAAAAILQHPNIVAIHDVGVHEGRHYFSMDYVEGQSLAQLVKQQPLAPARAAHYAEILAAAIHYAHEHGILHRDLKPSNVLIDADDQPRITDFGLARRLDGESSLTMTGQVLGSPNFMPPEQAGAKRGKVGRTSDVYALGGILYYLLTGRAPFQADSLEHLISQVLHADPVAPRVLNPAVPPDLETITLKCLEKEPSRRYQTAQELAEELGRVLRHEPICARPITPPEKLWRWCRRKPALAASLSLIAILLSIVIVGSPIAIFRINRERVHAEDARRNEAALRHAAETREKITRVRMLCDQKKWDQAKELISEISAVGLLPADKPDAASLHSALADGFARSGRWKKALAEVFKAVEHDPSEHMHWVSLLVLLAGTGQFDEYHLYRRQVLERFENLKEVSLGERIAKAALLLPGPATELLRAERLANAALIAPTNDSFAPYKEFAQGLADYRLGHFVEAIRWMQKSIDDPFYGAGQMRYVQSYMVLAMAQHRLNQHEAARSSLGKGLAFKDAILPKLESEYLGPDWYWRDWIIAEILTREAAALIKGEPDAAKEARPESLTKTPAL